MPLTFIDIERQKNWRIWAFFLILMLLYFVVTAVFTSIFLPVLVHTSALLDLRRDHCPFHRRHPFLVLSV
jgi:hypothetical protein